MSCYSPQRHQFHAIGEHFPLPFLTSPGTQLQHIEGSVLKDKKPYSARNFWLAFPIIFPPELCNLWVVPENNENDHHLYRILSNMLKDLITSGRVRVLHATSTGLERCKH